MKSNVIIMTTGLSGSSVVTALINQAGYWVGDETAKKDNYSGHYDTFENSNLVSLNEHLYKQLSFSPTDFYWYKENDFQFFRQAAHSVDPAPFRDFVDKCSMQDKNILKDPRLWITLAFWLPIIESVYQKNTKFIVLRRSPLAMWISLLLKRKIVGYRYIKKSEEIANSRITQYLIDAGYEPLQLDYSELLQKPDKAISKINTFLGCNLSRQDLTKVYRGKLPTPPWKWGNLIKASLIYLKNMKESYNEKEHTEQSS